MDEGKPRQGEAREERKRTNSGKRQDSGMEAYLHVFQAVLLADASKKILFATLLHLTGQQQLVKYKISLLEVEDDV